MTQLEAFILIGGRSSRLGTDKASVEFDGMTLAERAVDVVTKGLSPERVTLVAGAAVGAGIAAIRADVPFIFDLYEYRGPLGGLHAGLANARSEWIFVLACDYPLVSPELFNQLREHCSPEFGAVVPEQPDGRLQPLCAFYHVATARPILEEILERPRATPPVHEIVNQRLKPRVVSYGEYEHLPGADEFFFNVNTVDDLARARNLHSRRTVE